MANPECVEFLQWALPLMGFRWDGFRRVRRQVCRRVGRRVQALHLPGFRAYRTYLDAHPEEWRVLDSLCHVSISRFVRDRAVFDRLAAEVLPALAADAVSRNVDVICCWSAGCASGEEPYTLSILWSLDVASRFPSLDLTILATDVDRHLVERAQRGCYDKSSLREVPSSWMTRAFDCEGSAYVVRPEFRHRVGFRCEDMRTTVPHGPFDLILCRNAAFTYFDVNAQREVLQGLLSALRPGGGFVIGRKERLPPHTSELSEWTSDLGIFRKT